MKCPLASQPWELPMVALGDPYLPVYVCRHCGFEISVTLSYLMNQLTHEQLIAIRNEQYARAAHKAGGYPDGF